MQLLDLGNEIAFYTWQATGSTGTATSRSDANIITIGVACAGVRTLLDRDCMQSSTSHVSMATRTTAQTTTTQNHASESFRRCPEASESLAYSVSVSVGERVTGVLVSGSTGA